MAFSDEQQKALDTMLEKQLDLIKSMFPNASQQLSPPNPPNSPPAPTVSGTVVTVDILSATPDELRAAAGGTVTTSSLPPAAHLGPGFALGAGAHADPLAGKQALLRFPGVEQAVLREVMTHTADFRTLARLNPAYARADPQQILSVADGRISIVNKAVGKSFPNLTALLASFSVYFDILGFQLGASRGFESMWTLSHGWSLFQQQILQYNAVYEWQDLLNYLEQVFLRRRAEMLSGTYSGWWAPDHDLQSLYLHTPRARAPAASAQSSSSHSNKSHHNPALKTIPRSEQICYNFREGKCVLTPQGECPNRRLHTPAPATSTK